MISYEQYENKIKKFAKFRNFLNRFKLLIIAICALIIAGITTLLVMKGSFNGEITISSSTYGESYENPTGVSAFLSSVSYEYSLEGSDVWSSKKPVKAGKYLVRAVSRKAFGKGYGKTASFEIAPLEVDFSIISDSMEYGGAPSEISVKLLTGDKLDESALCYEYDYLSEYTDVDLIDSSIKIMNGRDDRSGCYIFKHEKKEMSITKRSIDVSLITEEFIYSGTAISYAHTASITTEARLANGDIIRIGSIELQQDGVRVEDAVYAGEYEAVICDFHIYKVINGTEHEVTSRYEATLFATAFQIAKKAVSVSTASAKKEYDGTPLTKLDGYSVSGLLETDSFSVLAGKSITNVGRSENNVLDYEITTRSGLDVTSNYEITYKYGTLIVEPRKITISSPSLKEVYSGQAYSATQLTVYKEGSQVDELFEAVAGDQITKITTVGKILNVLSFVIVNKTTSAVEEQSNFEITYQWGTLEVTQRAITITIDRLEKEYDGTPLFATPENNEVTADDLAEGDTLAIAAGDTLHKMTDVKLSGGEVAAVVNMSEYGIFCGNEDRTQNYKITYERGTLKITPRHITIRTGASSHMYDGEPYSVQAYLVYEGEDWSFDVLDNSLRLTKYPTFTNYDDTVGQTENNICEFSISDNYVIDEIIYGTVVILQRPLAVVSNSAQFVYDAEAHSDSGYTTALATFLEADGLIGTDELIVEEAPSFTNVWDTLTKQNNVCVYRVPNNNYTIESLTYGTIVITPRPIRVVTATDQKIYDSKPLSLNEYVETYYQEGDVKQEGLLNDDVLSLDEPYEIAEVWQTGDNVCAFSVPMENGTSNYEIVGYDYGTLTIIPRPICVVVASGYKIYDGGELSANEYTSTYYTNEKGEVSDGLLNGDKLTLETPYSIVNVSESGPNLCTFSLPTVNGVSNYTIANYVRNDLIIDPRPVTVQLYDIEAMYGEDYESYPKGEWNFKNASTCGMIGEDTIMVSISINLDRVTLANGYPAVKWTEDGEIDSYYGVVTCRGAAFKGDPDNYKFTYENGSLKITQRTISVFMMNANTFYGEDLHPVEDQDLIYRAAGVYPAGEGNVYNVFYVGEDGNSKLDTNGLLKGDTIEITKVRYFNNEMTSTGEKENYVTPKNAGTYYIRPFELYIHTVDNGDEITTDDEGGEGRGNYLITHYIQGTLKIHPRPIWLTLNEIETKMYDGQAVEYVSGGEKIELGESGNYPSQLIKEDALVYGERLNVRVGFFMLGTSSNDTVPPPIFAGTYKYTFDYTGSYIEAPNGQDGYELIEDGIANYWISGLFGTVQITKRPVTIRMDDLELVYGDAVRYPTGIRYTVVSEIDFVEGERIYAWDTVDFGYKRIYPSVGSYKIMGIPSAINYHGTLEFNVINVIDSYDLTVKEGELTITPLDVTITVWNWSATYGQDPNEVFAWDISPIISGATVNAELHYLQDGKEVTPKNVGFYDYTVIPVIRLEDGGYDVLYNYHFTYVCGDDSRILADAILEDGFEIKPLAITVSVVSQTITYGESFEGSFVTCWPYLAYGETLTASLYLEKGGEKIEPKYAGVYDLVIGELFVDGSSEGLKNYDIDRSGALEQGTLTITPRPIKARLENLTIKYGEQAIYPPRTGPAWKDYTMLAGTFVEGDELLIVPDFGLSQTNELRPDAGEYVISPASYTIKYLGQDTVDGYFVADSYDLEIENGTLTVKPREVVITLHKMPDFYYVGEAHYYPGGYALLEGDGMADGEELIVAVEYYFSTEETDPERIIANGTRVGEIGKAGMYAYCSNFLEFDVQNGGLKGINNYHFTQTSFTGCTVYRRSISVEYLDVEGQVYGTPVSYPETAGNYKSVTAVAPSGGDGLVQGEELMLYVIFFQRGSSQYTYYPGAVLPVGEYGLAITGVKITGGIYADAENYEIAIETKYFTVEKRNVTVTLLDIEADYGEIPVYPQYVGNYKDVENLADGETLTIVNVLCRAPEQASVGVYKDVVLLSKIKVVSASGVDVSENYTFDYIESSLIVNRRAVVVYTGGGEFVYDGLAHSNDQFNVDYVSDLEKNGFAYDDFGMLHEDYVGEGKLPSVTEYTGRSVQNIFSIVIMNGTKNVMDNYDITYVYGELMIERLILYVTTASYSTVYNGLPLKVEGNNIESCYYFVNNDPTGAKIDGLIGGHKFTFIETQSFIEVGEWDNNPIQDIVDEAGVSQWHNYTFASYQFGKVTIEPRILYVNASSDSKVYDGTPLYSPDDLYSIYFYPNNDRTQTPLSGLDVLVSGHEFIMTTPSALNVGEPVPNNPYAGVIAGDLDVSRNYYIVHESGYLTINQRLVAYRTESYKKTYNNAGPSISIQYYVEYAGEEGVDKDSGILEDDRNFFEFSIIYTTQSGIIITRFNAGTYRILLDVTNNTSYNNYLFVAAQEGTLTIEQAELILRPIEKYELYTHADQTISIEADDIVFEDGKRLADGDILAPLSLNRTSLNASENRTYFTIKINKSSVRIEDERTGDDVSDNYNVVLLASSIGFEQRTVYFEQILPSDLPKGITGRGLLDYTGSRYTITSDEPMFRVLTADEVLSGNWTGVTSFDAESYGLLDSDEAVLKSAGVSAGVGIYEQWVELDVVNKSSGGKVTKLYNLILVTAEGADTSIEVLSKKVSVTFNQSLNGSFVENAEVGITILDPDEYIASVEGLLADNVLAAALYKDEYGNVSLYIYIFVPRYKNGEISSRTDKSTIYEVTVTFASGMTLNSTLMNAADYPDA